MNLYNSNDIVLHTEDRNYHCEFFSFNKFKDAKEFFLYNLSEYKILDLRYFDGKKYIECNVGDLYN